MPASLGAIKLKSYKTGEGSAFGLFEPYQPRRGRDVREAGRAAMMWLPGNLGAEKLTPKERRRRFIEAAREAGVSEDEAGFDAVLKWIAPARKPEIA